MKRFLFLILLSFASTAFSMSVADISPDHRAVLSGDWKPSHLLLEKALRQIDLFLKGPISKNQWLERDVAGIRANKLGYRVQFVGKRLGGTLRIHCNFFPAPGDKNSITEFPYWRREAVDVDDGGFYFWHIDYDVDTDTCKDFFVNATA